MTVDKRTRQQALDLMMQAAPDYNWKDVAILSKEYVRDKVVNTVMVGAKRLYVVPREAEDLAGPIVAKTMWKKVVFPTYDEPLDIECVNFKIEDYE